MKLSRRHFLTSSSVLGVTAALGAPATDTTADETKPRVKQYFPNGIPRCTLGKTGIETSILGVGTGMTGGRPYYEMGEEKFVELMHYAYDQGVRYIDTAESYRMHIYVQRSLRGWKREDFYLLTKTGARSEQNTRADIGRYLHELNTKYLDTVLMHCQVNDRWPVEKAGSWNVLKDEKQKGRVRAIGISCHSFDAFKKCLEVDDLDVVLVRINPFGKEFRMDEDPDKVVPVIRELHEKGVGILGMKIFGEGTLTEPEQRRKSLQFIKDIGCVDTMTIGFTEIPQIDETLGMMAEIHAS